jgi:DNA-binding NtrC family response regulator
VLVIDDEQSFAEIISERLELRNFEVMSVFSGEEAIQLLEERDFDVILLDVLMPGKSGIDTLKDIMKIDPLSHIIMLTGHARVDTAMEGMGLGAYDYLIKPAEVNDLVEKIKLAYVHKVTQKEKTQHASVTRGHKRRKLGRLISPVYDFFHRDRPSKPQRLPTEDTDTDKDGP